ncbi:Uncharacterised protein [Mycobacteroides abscessus subsp. bolletii]|nr:Uncharacterised protein [Mycobacteroides abscessus subsp. bolletii]SHU76905.1 Uncharacterised protein [Mycobacteroides abscessus subsp. bolletii]SHX84084.1 Uncharacterised protein [Mycobacteroides abscessus subsp. bolletii]SHY37656.1 Uncharacterised protein [Mycobacteroides abscessus subsp. bolletii]SHZ31526.1 Uncharacterised protein [Mycobacteroides abscessus subsp. bolletii]
MGVVTGEAPLQPGPRDNDHKGSQDAQHAPEHRRDGVAEDIQFPARDQPQQPVGPHEINVRRRPGRHLRWLVGAKIPDRIDLQQAAHERQDGHDYREERAGFQCEYRNYPHTNDIGLATARARELGMFLVPDQGQVNDGKRDHDGGNEQHV